MNSPNNQKQKNIYAVIGFGRSGSSLITRGLEALGIDLGNRLVNYTATNPWNSKGFFEDKEIIYQVHAKVYAALGYGMRCIPLIDKNEQLSSKLDPIRNKAIELLNQRFLTTEHWGFKNPSTSKLIPFWQSIFHAMNIKENYIITLRNPLASAKSFSDLTALDLETCLLLWLMHNIPAIEDTHGKNRIVVSFESLLQDPHQQLQRIQNIFNIASIAKPSAIETFTHEFLDKKLNRHFYYDEELKTHPAISVIPLCKTVYELLLKLARDDITFDSQAFISAWQEVMNELAIHYPSYCFIDTILKRNKNLRRTLIEINKSVLWKILYPLRIIDNKLRARRLKARLTRRVVTAYE